MNAPLRQPPTAGRVEIFRVSDERDFEVYLDGVPAASFWRESFSPIVLSSQERSELARKAGVPDGVLRFSLSQPVWEAQRLDMDLMALSEAGALDYATMAAWRVSHPNNFDFFCCTADEARVELIKGGW